MNLEIRPLGITGVCHHHPDDITVMMDARYSAGGQQKELTKGGAAAGTCGDSQSKGPKEEEQQQGQRVEALGKKRGSTVRTGSVHVLKPGARLAAVLRRDEGRRNSTIH